MVRERGPVKVLPGRREGALCFRVPGLSVGRQPDSAFHKFMKTIGMGKAGWRFPAAEKGETVRLLAAAGTERPACRCGWFRKWAVSSKAAPMGKRPCIILE